MRTELLHDFFAFAVKVLVNEYLRVALDDARRIAWIKSRGDQYLTEAGQHRPLAPLLHLAFFREKQNEESREDEPMIGSTS